MFIYPSKVTTFNKSSNIDLCFSVIVLVLKSVFEDIFYGKRYHFFNLNLVNIFKPSKLN